MDHPHPGPYNPWHPAGWTYPPPYPYLPDHPPSAVAVTARFFPLAFMNVFLTVRIEVDGIPYHGNWGRSGRTVIAVPPGQRHVRVYMPHLGNRTGKSEVVIDVPAGQVVELEYRSPIFVTFFPGAVGPPPQQYPDLVILVVLVLGIVAALAGDIVSKLFG